MLGLPYGWCADEVGCGGVALGSLSSSDADAACEDEGAVDAMRLFLREGCEAAKADVVKW